MSLCSCSLTKPNLSKYSQCVCANRNVLFFKLFLPIHDPNKVTYDRNPRFHATQNTQKIKSRNNQNNLF